MPGRGRQTFNKNQKEQKRREKQQEKLARRAERKINPKLGPSDEMPEFPQGDAETEDSDALEADGQPAARGE
jgi:hypothetical protein